MSWFDGLLRLLPRDFDVADRAGMAEMHARRANEARNRGLSWLVWFNVREATSIVRIALLHRAPVHPDHIEALSFPEHTMREIRHALRRLIRTPGFALAALITLGVSIGANTAIFTLLERVVLAPLPYPSSDRIVYVDHTAPGVKLYSDLGTSVGLYREYGKLRQVEAIAMYDPGSATVSVDNDPERVSSIAATPSLADVLSTKPALGRWFTEDEAMRDSASVVVLTNALWQKRFGGARNVIGRTLRIDGVAHTIIGVMPRSFAFPDDKPQFIVPLHYNRDRFGGFNYRAVARVQKGTTMAELQREQNRVIADLPARFPDEPKITTGMKDAQLGAIPTLLRDHILGGVAQTFWILLAAVGIVLLIACSNLANLFLVRADGRHRDVAVRRALGAGSRAVSAFYLSESLVIGILGGAAGLAIAYAAVRILVASAPVAIPRLHEIRIDMWGVLFATSISLLAGVGVGFMPLVGLRKVVISGVLQESGRGNTAGSRRMHARRVLMAAQLALAAVLLVGAALMLQTFRRLQSVDPGFRTENRLVFSLGLSETNYPTREAAAAFQERVLERIGALPGVTAVAVTSSLPLTGSGAQGDPLAVRNHVDGLTKLQAVAQFRRVSPAFFSTLGMTIRSGRAFDASDAQGHNNVVVIDEALADVYFPGEDPLGKQIRPFGVDNDAPWLTIVGVANNTATYNLRETTPTPHLYFPTRSDANDDTPSLHNASYIVRTKGDPLALVSAVRAVLTEIDPTIAMAQPERFTDSVARADARTRFTMILVVIAAMVALALGLVGVYAVISYAVAQRTSEIGVRLALGARPPQVAAMIVRESGPVLLAGVLAGLFASIGAARALRALLFGVAWNDMSTYAVVALLLLLVGLAACWLPARRAARVSPLESLR